MEHLNHAVYLHAAAGPIVDPRLLDRCPFQPGDGHRWIVLANAGSEAHGTRDPTPGSIDDVDLVGAVLAPPKRIVGLHGFEHWQEFVDELDITVYSLRKLVTLWTKNNPNVLGVLWLPPQHYLCRDPLFELFWRNRRLFSSKRFAHAIKGYARAKLHDMDKGVYKGYMEAKRKAMVERHGYDCKSAAHLIRLLRMGVEFLSSEVLHVDRSHLDADDLKAIKRGERTRDAILAESHHLFGRLDDAAQRSHLPDDPDLAAIDDIFVAVTTAHLCGGFRA